MVSVFFPRLNTSREIDNRRNYYHKFNIWGKTYEKNGIGIKKGEGTR